VFQVIFAEECCLDPFCRLALGRQIPGEGIAQDGQAYHDHHQGNHGFYETNTCGGEKGKTPTHACIDPRVPGVSTAARGALHALRLACQAQGCHKL
jgi:hypothetical protein